MLEAAWLIPAFPLAGFLMLVLFGRRMGEPVAGWFATAAIGGSFLSTVVVFIGLLGEEPAERFFIQKIFTWIPSGTFSVDVGFLVDPLSITMCLFVTGVGSLIHLYSIGYMHGDENFSKFFLYLNLFAASMLMLVLGDNLLITFLGWEGVGACSYLLISFWFHDPANASAGKKAFVTNRVGDFGFMLGAFLLFNHIGSIRYADVLTSHISTGTATVIVLLFLLAAAGKSAQIPLFVWLPDAMAGPTPVSALIHAATMVTSGVYLLTRLNPVLAQADPWATDVIAWLGAATALVAALAAISQTDIKKVLAYSTVSQLGYLFLAVGVGAYVPAIFHMITHAFFKALLFLGSGSVIHGMHDEQDMRRMGGLAKLMPITAGTFIVGWLAIAGVPPFSGFWSKDEILLYAWNDNKALWLVGFVTALLTAFYMTRQVILTFFGRTRFWDATSEEIGEAFDAIAGSAQAKFVAAAEGVTVATAAVDKANLDVDKRTGAVSKAQTSLEDATSALAASSEGADGYDKLVKAVDKATKGVPKAEAALQKAVSKTAELELAVEEAESVVADTQIESKRAASISYDLPGDAQYVTAFSKAPDIAAVADDMPESYHHRQEYNPHESPWTMTAPLVILAVAAALGGLMNLPFAHDLHFLGNWLEPSLFANEVHVTTSTSGKWMLAVVAVLGGLSAIVAAFAVYLRGKGDLAKIERKDLALAVTWDAVLAKFMGGPGKALFDGASWFDKTFVDGAVNGAATAAQSAGKGLRPSQSGLARQYALFITGTAGLIGLWFVLRLVAS